MEIEVKEFAARCGVTPNRVKYLLRHGAIPSRRIPENGAHAITVIDDAHIERALVLLAQVRTGRPARLRRMPPEAITIREMAERLGLPRWKVYDEVRTGKRPAAGRVGNDWYFLEEGEVSHNS